MKSYKLRITRGSDASKAFVDAFGNQVKPFDKRLTFNTTADIGERGWLNDLANRWVGWGFTRGMLDGTEGWHVTAECDGEVTELSAEAMAYAAERL